MQNLTNWTQIAIESLVALGQKVMTELPNILGAIFLIIVGWIIAKLLSYIVRKALGAIQFDKLSEKLNTTEILEKAHININPSQVVSKFVYWIIILLFFVTASDTLGWGVVATSISDLLTYLPKLFSAVIIFVIGLYIANFVRRGLQGIFDSLSVSSGKVVSSVAFYIIAIIITLTALNQAGVDTSIITNNVTIILGGVILSFAVSFGLASKDVLHNILSAFYSRNNFSEGQQIELNGHKGKIEKIDNISVTIVSGNDKTVIPARKLLSEDVKIIG
ncbi:MAG: hypothetical protein RJQ09_20185 [Cyclobacteriaceae bacterium]